MDGLFPNFLDILKITVIFISKGGWILFVWGMTYMLYKLYRGEIEHQFIHDQKWVFLNIKVPKNNMTSTLAVESIFVQMHALHAGLTFPQIYMEGHTQLWYSLEIVSMGGKTSFILRVPQKMQNVVEAAFYANYPDAEITEVADYMENFKYDPEDENNKYDIWGTEWKIEGDYAIPIKTYKDFEHPTAEEKIIDPLSGIFESMSKMEPHEFFGIQIIIQPVKDEDWKPHGENVIKKLTGEEVPHEVKFSDIILWPLNAFAKFSFKDAILGGGHGHGHGHEESANKPKNNWMSMTEMEKERVSLVERKIGKAGYKTKMRTLYIAPKDKFDSTKRSMIVGGLRVFGSIMTNKIKPDTKRTWTRAEYKISPTLEKPFLDMEINKKKRYIFKGYKGRDIHLGLPMFIMNVEEIATLYHFPITTEARPMIASVEQTLSKKSQPPSNLPVAEE